MLDCGDKLALSRGPLSDYVSEKHFGRTPFENQQNSLSAHWLTVQPGNNKTCDRLCQKLVQPVLKFSGNRSLFIVYIYFCKTHSLVQGLY